MPTLIPEDDEPRPDPRPSLRERIVAFAEYCADTCEMDGGAFAAELRRILKETE
jgi:hypothetical protein